MTTHARSGDPLYTSQNPHRLYRNPANGVLFGVCAGLADYLACGACTSGWGRSSPC